MHSPDADHWQEASVTATTDGLDGVAWGDGTFVAVASESIVHSRDGDHWERARDTGTAGWLTGVAWGGGRFVAVSASVWFGQGIIHSVDGDRWEAASDSGTSENLRDVTWGNGVFVAVGINGAIVHSSDGDRLGASERQRDLGLAQRRRVERGALRGGRISRRDRAQPRWVPLAGGE